MSEIYRRSKLPIEGEHVTISEATVARVPRSEQLYSVAVKQGINPKSTRPSSSRAEALNTKQYQNPNAQILNVLVI
jgi:hypothetical protein